MKFIKLSNCIVILILINICTTLSLESVSLQSKAITTNDDEPKSSVTTENFHRKQRQSRCIRCYEDGQNTESDSRYGNRYFDDGGRRNRYYPSYPSRRINYDDSNWYNPHDRYDRPDDKTRYNENRYPERYFNRLTERDRYTGDRYVDRYPFTGTRNDDRYHSRTYDQYDNRPPIYNNRYDSRVSYDQGQEYRGRYNERERPYDRPRTGSYNSDRNYDYDPYDRHNTRDYDYDYRNHRPVDETYRDNQPGRGYANSDLPQRPNTNYQNNFPYPPTRNAYLPNPQSPPRPIQSQNSSINSNHDSSPDYHNNNSRPPPSYAGDWSYSNDRNKPGYNTDKDKEINSYQYGGRQRGPITGSYLFDRGSNIPMDLQNKDSRNSTEENTTSNKNDNDNKNDMKNNK